MIYLNPEKWAAYLNSQPETGMGYVIVSVILKDGRQLDKVTIVGGVIVSINGAEEIPFVEDDIAQLRVTHAK